MYARGNDRQAIFMDDVDRLRYLATLADVVDEMNWNCLGYALMSNHVHLIVETPDANLARGMCRLQGLYARSFNVRYGRINHLFGQRYGMKAIRSDEHLMYAAAYVALNPVRAGLCHTPAAYEWSSHAAVTGLREAPPWLAVSRLLSCFSGFGVPWRDAYIALVDAVRRGGADASAPSAAGR